MIAALFALAAAMVIAGCAAVVQGFPYVRLESGLAMVIAGAVAASSGTVLFGLGVVASGLRRVERAAGRSATMIRGDGPDEPAAPHHAAPSDARPRLPPVLPMAPAPVPPTVEPAIAELSLTSEASRIEPGPHTADRAPAADLAEPEPELPIPGLALAQPAPERKPETAEPAPAAAQPPEDDLFTATEDGPGTDRGLSLRRSLDPSPDPEPEPEPTPLRESAPERTVVGRYASGGNTYVMFEGGAIEADTPQGRFTFASLDELKAFVDGGGESGTRGAA